MERRNKCAAAYLQESWDGCSGGKVQVGTGLICGSFLRDGTGQAVEVTTMSLTRPNSSVCFYHGFVLGLMVELKSSYEVTSNRESGFGRYDIMLVPREMGQLDPMVIEFKVRKPRREASLEETVTVALQQIEDKEYDAVLVERGFEKERIRHYGFAFEDKQVLIG